MSVKQIQIIPLGGLGEIGMNMMVVEYKNEIIIIDAGIMFPTENLFGVDVIIPDFSYIRQNRKKVKAILFTHGHEDHIGALPFLWQEIEVPIYGTPMTLALIRSKAREHSLSLERLLYEVKPRDRVTIGSYKVEFINVNHSIPGCVALALMTEVGTIIHTGDIKIDTNPVDGANFDHYSLARYGEEGVLLLMADSTNAARAGFTASESSVKPALESIIKGANGRLIIASFASNVFRIKQIVELLLRYQKRIALSGMSMIRNVEIAIDLGYLEMEKTDFISLNEIKHYPEHEIAVLTTGSQGEPLSALTRIAFQKHAQIKIHEGDSVIISASVIPGNEKKVGKIINKLLIQQAKVYSNLDFDIHVSGHASSEELKEILNLTRPHFYMPVHGEYRMLLKNAELSKSLGYDDSRIIVALNGDVIQINQDCYQKNQRIAATPVYVDGKGIGDVGPSVLKDRETLAENGFVLVSLYASQDWLLMESPRVVMRGFLYIKTADMVKASICAQVETIVEKFRQSKKKKGLENMLKTGVKRLLLTETGKKPVVEIEIFYAAF